ncbi:MAG: hexulose-6-phosphate isomerase [Spirochaetes bacterium GWF1_51_8]|nr:MAG: hexulose-6-phosphate isomerase [Spirochaetes bacterium GWF1_51_8]
MSIREKLIERFLQRPKDFTYLELQALLKGFGYHEISKGQTSGSRVGFIQQENHHIILLHKPHPGNELKRYQIDLITEEVRKQEFIP